MCVWYRMYLLYVYTNSMVYLTADQYAFRVDQ